MESKLLREEAKVLRQLLAQEKLVAAKLRLRVRSQDAALNRLTGFVELLNRLMENPNVTNEGLGRRVRAEVNRWVAAVAKLDGPKHWPRLRAVPQPQNWVGPGGKLGPPPSAPVIRHRPRRPRRLH